MPIPTNLTFHVANRSLHPPRDSTRHGPQHVTIIVIAVLASLGAVLLTLLCWHFLSRLSRSYRSAPLPPRQDLVHQREQQLAAFTEHLNTSVPRIFLDARPSAPGRQGSSNASLIPHVDNISPNNSYRVSYYETDDGTEGQSTSHVNSLQPPTPRFSAPHSANSASSTSLPSSNEHHSEPTSLAVRRSSSGSPGQSQRRSNPRSRPRPFSVASDGTAHTGITVRSRNSMRGAPHAPHVNVQIVLPAPLAPNLYPPVVDEFGRRSLVSDTTYSDTWRSSLADKWISVGQQSDPSPKPVKRQCSHDSMVERRSQHAQKDTSLGPISQRRGNSNLPTLSHTGHFRRRSVDNSLLDSPPPVPRVPSAYVTVPKHHSTTPSEREALPSPPSSFPSSRKLRS
ncbi:hypothetical protein V8E53_006476 [Lactarius tabidus]